MNWSLSPLGDAPATPWRNGGGVTRELLAWPAAGEWQVRISVADVDRDGPFSAFPGVHRSFSVLQGAGVLLRLRGETWSVEAEGPPVTFDGDEPVDCRLIDGPTRDLNFMVRGAAGAMQRCKGELELPVRGMVAMYSPDAVLTLHAAGFPDLALPASTLAWCHSPTGMRVRAKGSVFFSMVAQR